MAIQKSISALSTENSWWNEGGLWQDVDLQRVKNAGFDYRPEVFSAEDIAENGVFTLRGPRRVGKTVTLKLLIANLIENHGWNPKSIVWFSAETTRRLEDLEDRLVQISELYQPKVIFIDEITSVIGWQKVIKKLRDSNVLANISVVLTGSSARDLKIGAERMAGRRGTNRMPDRVLLPMDFPSFVAAFKNLKVDIKKLIEMYLVCGGFPFRVAGCVDALKRQVDFSAEFGIQILDDVLFYEIQRCRLDRNIAIEIIGRLSSIGIHACSYDGFVKPLSIAKETAQKYLNVLGDAYLLATIYSYDKGRGRVAPKKDKKFMWIDPALSYLAPYMQQGSPLDDAARAEILVGKKLIEEYEFRLFEGLSAPRNVFTWKSSSGNEIDFLIVNKKEKKYLPFEMKYQEQISDWDFQVMERAFGRGYLITRGQEKQREKSQAIALDKFLIKDW